MWQSRCIATWGRPDTASVVLHFKWDARARFEVEIVRCCFIAFYCMYDMLRCDPDLWPYGPWRVQTLYKIWAKSNNPRRSYGDFSIWPYDPEHVPRAVLCSGITFTLFKLTQPIRSWHVTVFWCLGLFHTGASTHREYSPASRREYSLRRVYCSHWREWIPMAGHCSHAYRSICASCAFLAYLISHVQVARKCSTNDQITLNLYRKSTLRII